MLSSTSGTGLVSPISNGANDVDLTLRGLNGGSFENRLVLDSDGDVTMSQWYNGRSFYDLLPGGHAGQYFRLLVAF